MIVLLIITSLSFSSFLVFKDSFSNPILYTDEDDLIDVLEEIISVKLAYFSLGQSLRLKTNDLRRIRQEYPNDSDANLALSEVLVLWLQRKYNVGRFGPPTWRMLVEAVHRKVGADDDDLAKQIALKHPAGTISILVILL